MIPCTVAVRDANIDKMRKIRLSTIPGELIKLTKEFPQRRFLSH
jgi:hypothetical protein